MAPLRIAVIGGGEFGREHVAVYRSMPSVQLVAIVEANEKRRREWQTDSSRGDADIFSSVTEMLAHTKLDAASIVTPSSTRLEICSEVMLAGVDILVEKPFADTPEDAQLIATLAGKLGRICLPGHILRFSSDHRALKSKVTDGVLGEIVAVTLRRNRSRALSSQYPDIHPVLLIGVHDIDLAIWFTSEPVCEVSAIEHRDANGAVDFFTARFLHEHGAISTVHGSYLLPEEDADQIDDEVSIYGLLGTATLKLPKSDSAVPRYGSGVDNAPLVVELNHFVECVIARRPSDVCSLADAVHVVEVAQAVIRSAAAGGENIQLRSQIFDSNSLPKNSPKHTQRRSR